MAMKNKRRIFSITLSLACLLGLNTISFSQESSTANQTIESRVKNKNFVFVAESVLPMGSRTVQLTSWYDLKVAGDSLYSHLPYFGRAFSAPINPKESGYIFTTAGIEYEVNNRKKKGLEVTIVPQNRSYGEKFMLTVHGNGAAVLRVISNNRQAISYRGYIKEKST